MKLELDMFQTLLVAVAALLLGQFLRKKIRFFTTFCIPAPVVGGLIFSTVTLALYLLHVLELSFDGTIKDLCMLMFFTTVGFQANLKTLRKGSVGLLLLLAAVTGLIVLQNAAAVGIGKLLRIDPLAALCTGSIPMVGGHGTAGAFGPILEDLGVTGATTICTAAATFGLIAGSIMGGPVGRMLVNRYRLTPKPEDVQSAAAQTESTSESGGSYAKAVYLIAIAMGVGTLFSKLLGLTGLTFPNYIGGMLAAAILRNVSEYTGKISINMKHVDDVGSISLSLFLGIAMITLRFWELADLALPLLVLLAGQTVLMFLYARFAVFNILGRDYDAAVITSGVCGFGMGATPNAMANMDAMTTKYGASIKAYLLVPIVGGMFVDFINSLIVTGCINIL